jgi:membrane protein required for beta-lactamase induction
MKPAVILQNIYLVELVSVTVASHAIELGLAAILHVLKWQPYRVVQVTVAAREALNCRRADV